MVLSKNHQRPVLYGEVLFDIYPDGKEILGGAPFNVAYHLAAYGFDPLLISSVGDDERGKKILDFMDSFNMDTKGIQIHPNLPTGIAEITTDPKNPEFKIKENVAWDEIVYTNARFAIDKIACGILYHGTIALRNLVSRKTLDLLLREKVPVFEDINLRYPFFTDELINKTLRRADILKLNKEELYKITDTPVVQDGAIELIKENLLDKLIVTMGEQGIAVFDQSTVENDEYQMYLTKETSQPVIDTVGAGDAVSSVMIMGEMLDWDLNYTLSRAVKFGTEICTINGAIPANLSFYNRVKLR